MEKIRKASREAAAKKVKALTMADPHQKVDSSTWTPPEALNAGVKTGMRPISPRAYKRGGKVTGDVEGKKAKVRGDRKARKSGGSAGEQPPVDRYINRDLKKANEYREGTKHIGGMKSGGRTKKDVGGGTPYDVSVAGIPQGRGKALTRTLGIGFKKGGKVAEKQMGGGMTRIPMQSDPATALAVRKKMMSGLRPARGRSGLAMAGAPMALRKDGGRAAHPDVAEDKKLIKKMVKPEAIRKGREDGGKAKSPTPDELRAMYAASKAKMTADPNYQKKLMQETPPGYANLVRMGQKNGGKAKWIQSAIKKPGALHKQLGVPAGEKIPAKKLAAAAEKGGKLGKRARLAQTLRKMHATGGSVFKGDSKTKIPGVTGGRQAHKNGGRAKGKTNINIVVSPSTAPQQAGPMIPGGGLPRVPGLSPAPMMPPVGMAPPPAAMPPMAGGPPMGMAGLGSMAGGMPPMARKAGGRVYRSYKDMDAGAGSGEGRLEKTEIAERAGRKVGGRAYHSYKDMDAGAGSGEGRLEKTEIQQHKR